jgi:plasmid maintenance system antidote protein VapI
MFSEALVEEWQNIQSKYDLTIHLNKKRGTNHSEVDQETGPAQHETQH